MASYKVKAGTAIRGRRRVVRVGMGSGRSVARAKAERKKGKRG
jgi:hypothetical protein